MSNVKFFSILFSLFAFFAGIDVVEFVEHNLSRERTRKQIIREMKSLGLDTFGAKTKTGFVSQVFHFDMCSS